MEQLPEVMNWDVSDESLLVLQYRPQVPHEKIHLNGQETIQTIISRSLAYANDTDTEHCS